MIGRIRRLPGIFHGLASTCGGVNYTTGSRRLELALKLLLSLNAVPPRVKKGEGIYLLRTRIRSHCNLASL